MSKLGILGATALSLTLAVAAPAFAAGRGGGGGGGGGMHGGGGMGGGMHGGGVAGGMHAGGGGGGAMHVGGGSPAFRGAQASMGPAVGHPTLSPLAVVISPAAAARSLRKADIAAASAITTTAGVSARASALPPV